TVGSRLEGMLERLGSEPVAVSSSPPADLHRKGGPRSEAPRAAAKTPSWKLRAIVVAVSLVAWFWTQSLIGHRSPPVEGIGDGLHAVTEPANRYLFNHPRSADLLLIVSSAFIDLFAVFLLARGIFGSSLQ